MIDLAFLGLGLLLFAIMAAYVRAFYRLHRRRPARLLPRLRAAASREILTEGRPGPADCHDFYRIGADRRRPRRRGRRSDSARRLPRPCSYRRENPAVARADGDGESLLPRRRRRSVARTRLE